jgi:hypothetical protein
MLKTLIVFLILFFSIPVILPTQITITDSLVDKSNNHEWEKRHINYTEFLPESNNNIYETFNEPFLLLLGLLVGYLFNFLLNKRTIRMTDIVNRSNVIKTFLVDAFVTIDNICENDKISVGDVVVHNIQNTETLIQQFLFYIGKRKRNKITKHYQKYINPYFLDQRAYGILYVQYLDDKLRDKGIKKPSRFGKTEIKNEKERAMKNLKILIKDFSHV